MFFDSISKTVSVEQQSIADDERMTKYDRINFKVTLTQNYEKDVAEFRNFMKMKEISYEPSSSTMGVENINRDKLNMIVHADIIKTLMSDCAIKILACGILPSLMTHHIEILFKQFPAELIEYLKAKLSSTTSLPSENQRKYVTIVGNQVDLELVNLGIALKNKCLTQLALKLKNRASPASRNLYDALNGFIEVILGKLVQTAEEITYKQTKLSNGYRMYKERMFYITRNQQKFEQHEREVNQKIKAKDAEIELLKIKIAKHLVLNKQQINNIVDESEHKMKKKSVIVGAELLEKQEQAEQSKTKYQNLLANHLALEKELRKKKRRVESTLQNWLGKFDDDMIGKQAEVDMLTESLEQEVTEYNELQCLLLEDNKRYEKYSKEKRIEDDNAIKIKAQEFIWERAAKLIQTTFKEYKRIMALRKQRRKKK